MKIFKKWWWYSTGFHLHKIIWEGIKNLWKWFPLVWNDRDYDHAFIFDVLKFKIKNTADYIEKHKRYEDWEYDVEKMRLCIRLIDKIQNDDYQSEYQNYYETDLFTKKIEDKELYELKSNVLRDDLVNYFNKYSNDFRKLPESYKDHSEVSKALIMGGMRQAKANKLLFTIIEKNIHHWWD